ncbi:MAG: carbohydrate ABC transporter permease [Chloroflexota bacterium]
MMTQPTQSMTVSNKRKNADLPLWKQVLPKYWYAHVVLIIAIIIIGFPMFYALLISTQNNAQVYNHQWYPGTSFFDNLQTVMITRNMGQYMMNSAFIAMAIAIGKTIMSVLAGLGLVYFRYPGKWLVFGFVLITLIMPGDILLIALYRRVIAYEDVVSGWLNPLIFFVENWQPHPYYSLILPLLASATGVFIFRQHFMTIPSELSEAAQLDGANPLQFLFRVLMPLSWNTIGALMVIMFLYGWNQFLWPLILLREQSQYVVQWGIQSLSQSAEIGDIFGPQMMGVVVTSLPPILLFIVLQRQFMRGFALTSGSK